MRRTQRGSMTVEAAFVVPIVIFVILAVIYLTFFLHDRVRAETVAGSALEMAGRLAGREGFLEMAGRGGEIEEAVGQMLEEELGKGFFFLEREESGCEVTCSTVKVTVRMRGRISLAQVASFWMAGPSISLERSASAIEPEEVLRAYEGMGLRMEGSQGMEFMRRKLQGWMSGMGG